MVILLVGAYLSNWGLGVKANSGGRGAYLRVGLIDHLRHM